MSILRFCLFTESNAYNRGMELLINEHERPTQWKNKLLKLALKSRNLKYAILGNDKFRRELGASVVAEILTTLEPEIALNFLEFEVNYDFINTFDIESLYIVSKKYPIFFLGVIDLVRDNLVSSDILLSQPEDAPYIFELAKNKSTCAAIVGGYPDLLAFLTEDQISKLGKIHPKYKKQLNNIFDTMVADKLDANDSYIDAISTISSNDSDESVFSIYVHIDSDTSIDRSLYQQLSS